MTIAVEILMSKIFPYPFYLFLCLLFFYPFTAQAQVFEPEFFTLDNGLRAVVVSNDRAPVVTHMVWYGVGRRDEPYGKSGLAHFLEHLMFKGTPTVPDAQFSKIITSLGGRDNAFTAQDYTAYFQSIAKNHLSTVMAMEADRMTNLAITPEIVEAERKVIMAERNQRIDNDPINAFWEDVSNVLFVNHPYSIPVIGWAHEIEQLTYDDVIRFYKRWYAPNNATVILSGDITTDEARSLIKQHYGVIPVTDLPPRKTYAVAAVNTEKAITKHSDKIKQRLWSRHYIAPSASNEMILAADSLEVAARILGGDPTSRLYQSLVVDQKLATQASVSYRAEGLGPQRFTVLATLADGISEQAVIAAVDQIFDQFIAEGPTEEELNDAVQGMTIEAIYARDSLQGPAMILGRSLLSGLDLNTIEAWPTRLQQVSQESIKTIIAPVLNPSINGGNPPITARLLPARNNKTRNNKN